MYENRARDYYRPRHHSTYYPSRMATYDDHVAISQRDRIEEKMRNKNEDSHRSLLRHQKSQEKNEVTFSGDIQPRACNLITRNKESPRLHKSVNFSDSPYQRSEKSDYYVPSSHHPRALSPLREPCESPLGLPLSDRDIMPTYDNSVYHRRPMEVRYVQPLPSPVLYYSKLPEEVICADPMCNPDEPTGMPRIPIEPHWDTGECVAVSDIVPKRRDPYITKPNFPEETFYNRSKIRSPVHLSPNKGQKWTEDD